MCARPLWPGLRIAGRRTGGGRNVRPYKLAAGLLGEIVTPAFVVFLFAFLILATRFLIRANRDDGVAARRILDERYVSGEIDHGEYEQKRRDLGGRAL